MGRGKAAFVAVGRYRDFHRAASVRFRPIADIPLVCEQDAVRLVITLALIVGACGPSPTDEIEADATALLRSAVAFRDESFGDWRDACVVLPLREPLEEGTGAGPNRIPVEWISGTRTTEQRFGCATTIVYSRPSFQRTEELQGLVGTIEVDRLCGELCGDTGTITFLRRDGATEWENLGFHSGVAY